MRHIPGVATLALDQAACIGCGMCLAVCPHAVFRLEGRTAAVADRDACMECGACARNCPVAAVAVTPGVGCAGAIIKGWITGGPPSCDCSGGSCC